MVPSTNISRREVMTLGGATIAAAMMTPFEALARGMTIEGVRASYAAQVRSAIAGMRSLNIIREQLLACQAHAKTLDPYSEEGYAADSLQSHLLFEQGQAMFRYGGMITGAAFSTTQGRMEKAIQRDARVLFKDLYGKELKPWKLEYAALGGEAHCSLGSGRERR
jgi:hypothetical protein